MNKILSVFIIFVLLSCQNTESKKDPIKINITEKQEKAKPDGITEVILVSNDQMRFNLKQIKVNKGDKVKLTLKHTGQLNKKIMGHNFVLLKPNVDIVEFNKLSMQARRTEFIPENSEDIIVHTKMIGGGEETTITFDAPAIGVYDFVCSFPGHIALMNGKFIVE